jgi:hypothetical protein
MHRYARRIAGFWVVVGLAALLVTAPSSAGSRAAAVNVPCDPTALTTEFTNANLAGTATLRLASNCAYQLTAALPAVTGDVAVHGGTYTTITRAAGAPAFRFFDVGAGATLRINNVMLVNGSETGLGGAIQSAGTLAVKKVVFAHNTSSSGGGLAVLAGGSATVASSTFTANTTTGVGGGAIINFGSLTMSSSDLTANTAPINGGALNTQPGGTTAVTGGTISLNTSGSLGGAFANLGTTLIKNAKILSNVGSGGGGIATGNGNVTLTGTSVQGNVPDNCNPLNTIPKCSG